jgi:hypothetical protein
MFLLSETLLSILSGKMEQTLFSRVGVRGLKENLGFSRGAHLNMLHFLFPTLLMSQTTTVQGKSIETNVSEPKK